jgi:5'-nucleotidase / UDP-sugar diphosphatase
MNQFGKYLAQSRSFLKNKGVLMAALLLLLTPLLFANEKYPPEDFQKVVILFTNDMHGGIDRQEARFMNPDFPPRLGGGAVVTRYAKMVRAEAEAKGWGVIMIDAGDFFQGTPVGTFTKGEAVIDFMNMAGYDAMVAGNHDFDLSWEVLRDRAAQANFPILGANIVNSQSGEVADFLEPYVIKEIAGIKFGILGISTSATPGMSFPDHVAGLTFIPDIKATREWVPKVKEAGADILILSTHSWTPYDRRQGYLDLLEDLEKGINENKIGPNALEIAALVPGIDLMFSGHVHRGFNTPYEDPVNHTLIFQNYANGGNLGHLNIYIHRETKTLAGYDFQVDGSAIFTLFEDEFWLDDEADSLISAYKKRAEAGFDEVITTLPQPLRRAGDGQSLLGNMIVDAMNHAVQSDIAMSNFGGVRNDLEAGPITVQDVFRVLPFGNKITVFQVSGAFILELMEDRVTGNSRGMLLSGAEVTIDKRMANRERVTIHTIQGKPFDPEKIYHLAVSDYLAEGNSGFGRLTEVDPNHVIYTGTMLRQALIDYMKAGLISQTKIDKRWTLIKD